MFIVPENKTDKIHWAAADFSACEDKIFEINNYTYKELFLRGRWSCSYFVVLILISKNFMLTSSSKPHKLQRLLWKKQRSNPRRFFLKEVRYFFITDYGHSFCFVLLFLCSCVIEITSKNQSHCVSSSSIPSIFHAHNF